MKSLWITCFVVVSAVSVQCFAQPLPPQDQLTYLEKNGLSATVIDFSPPKRPEEARALHPVDMRLRAQSEWGRAQAACSELDFKGGGGWRLPNRDEVRKMSVYENRALLPAQLRNLTDCDIRVWINESEADYDPSRRRGVIYCVSSRGEEYQGPLGALATSLAMCVRDGKPKAPIVFQEKEKKREPNTNATNQLLTFAPDPKKELEAQAATRLQVDRNDAKVRAAKEQQVAKENAERQLVAFDRELKDRQQCALPQNQDSCNCGKYQAKTPGRRTCGK